MKSVVLKVLKGFAVIFCIMGLITYTSMILFPQMAVSDAAKIESARPVLVFLDALLLFCLYLLLRKKNGTSNGYQPQVVSPYLPEISAETLRDMKRHYTAVQIQNDVRIMQESFQLIQQTTDFDTFFSRLELAQQKSLTLLQAVQAGCKGIQNKQQTIKACEDVLSNVQNAKTVFLDNSYQKVTASAMQLKTKSGQYKRLVAYLEQLKSYETEFVDTGEVYGGVISKLQDLIKERQPAEKSSAPRPKQSGGRSPADEIMKFKQLLDAGAITQEEYDAKKAQLLDLSPSPISAETHN